MTCRVAARWCTVAAAALCTVRPTAQGTQQTPVFRSTLEVVQIDVIVRDRTGNPVHGLTAADFTLLDRGRPQQIVAFKEIRRTPEPAAPALPLTVRRDVASNSTAQSDRLVVIVLDDLHGYRGRDETVRSIAARVVEDLGPRSTVALITTSGDQRVEPTDDRSRLLDAISRFKGARAERRPILAVDSRRSNASLGDFDANMRLFDALKSAARALGANDGRRKAFILISENVAKDLTGLFSSGVPPGQAPPDASGYFLGGNMEALLQVPEAQHHDFAILEMVEAMRRGNVATYAIDPRGHIPPAKIEQECFPAPGLLNDPCLGGSLPAWHAWVRQAQRGLEIMSEASGGFAVVDTNDFTGGVSRILTDLDNYYLLGFSPVDREAKGYRRLEVRVPGHPDVTLRYRRGYDLGGRRADEKASDPLFALSRGALPSTGLPLRLHAAALPTPGRDGRLAIAIEVTVPRAVLRPATTASRTTSATV